MKTQREAHATMNAALTLVLGTCGGEIPGGVTPVQYDGVTVRVFGINPLRTVVVVQFIADGVGYSAYAGKGLRLGKVGNFNP